jgi:UDP:flavonoid glycosyltransferase YjiC (YdhE family)
VPAPENVDVVRAAPHREVLREAQLVVTHCGHGTTVKALAAGVPIVGLPMGRDQLDVAARLVHAGAGVRLDHRDS